MKPILFTTEMVKAILAGRKSQTRRVIKEQADGRGYRTTNVLFETWHGREVKCKYEVWDILYVRETWLNDERGSENGKSPCYYYKADMQDPNAFKGYWKSSRFMPKAAARIFLKVTDVRVERVREISEQDAIAEGCEPIQGLVGTFYKSYQRINANAFNQAKWSYRTLWESINGKGSWALNPWVWVITFKRIDKEV